MKIASHNTMTYLPVKKWYMNAIKWAAKCQNRNFYEQWKNGARMFDLRVRFDREIPYFCHGPVEFKGDVLGTLENIYWLSEKNDPIHVRIMLESNSEMKDQKSQEINFNSFCSYIKYKYDTIIFIGGNRKYDGKVIYNFYNPTPTIEGKYSSAVGSKIDDIFPYFYAKLNNKKNIKKGTDKDFLMIDFV